MLRNYQTTPLTEEERHSRVGILCRGLESVKLVVSFDEHARLGSVVNGGQLQLQSLAQQS